ncbi:C50 family peptidase [Aspergillus melleus]|uniref:C50 family peptidase n=1 Tax=Aspergillus melleus TaxID=138277 RepID=UPI001E8D8502|nr:separin protein [Aspergillus melleus]KAH8423605.1 separin protein [Aspergillus melleus]
MTVTNLLPDPSVESVKLAVRSTAACSNATVLTLQTLFGPASKSPLDTKSDMSSRRARTTKITTTSTTRTKAPTGTTRTKVTGRDAVLSTLAEKDASRLSYQEKLVLATEVFNTTLKTLSDAVKLQTSKRDEARSRGSTSPETPKKTTDAGLLALSECATMALSSLRTLKLEQGSQDNTTPNVQLEQGACVLAGRYLSLGLNDMAYKELRGLKRRIQQFLDSKATARKKTTKSEEGSEDAMTERMSDLIGFTNLTQAQDLLGLLVSFQSNALRLIASEKKASTIQKAASLLQLSSPSSPANVIVAAMDNGALAKDKAAVQLQLLSNTVLSLSSSSSKSTDGATTKDRLKPMTALNLQLLALEVRCMSWKISGHKCDDGREVWDPLARYLASFTHNNKGIEKTEFAITYKTIVRLQSAVAKTPKSTATNMKDNHSVAKIATVLGQLAQEAGCFDEALQLFTESLTPFSSMQSLSLATVRCKIGVLYFEGLRKSKKFAPAHISNAVSEATATLSMPLKGSPSDLDELLVEAARLKKYAMAWFGDLISKQQSRKAEDSDIAARVYEFLAGFLKFLRRYIGRPPSEDDDSKGYETFSKRVSTCQSIALAAVDSAIAVGKLSVMSQRPAWEDILSSLADCQRLLTVIDSTDMTDSSLIEQTGMGFVKMSNLFWSRYLKEKEAGKGYRELVPLLRQSANLLSPCLPAQRITGFAALKYERLAHVYMEGNMNAESEQAFCQSIREHIENGTLKQIVSDSSSGFPHRTSQDTKSNAFMVGRVLSAFLKVKLRSKKSKVSVFDDEGLTPLVRGHLLEWQMGILTELHVYATNDEVFRGVFNLLLAKLLDIYSFELNPIRRLRVVLCGLRFSLERPSALEPSLLQQLIDEAIEGIENEEIGEDTDLFTFSTHLKNSVRLTLGLHQGDLRPNQLDHVISSWTAMMRNCHDWELLVSYVGDVDYCLVQMKAVVDYTEIHGLWKLQLSALELILRVNELQESGDFSEAILILSRLVLQYCRLGFCTKANTLLIRADQCLAQNDVSCLATLSHRLARVGYLLETGDIEKAAVTLSAARVLYEKSQRKQDLNSCSVLTKIAWERLVADAAFMSSRLSFAQGSTNDALFFAKLSVRLNCRIWAKVEKLAQRKQDKSLPSSESSELETVVEGMAKLDVTQASTGTTSYSQGAPFWPHIGSHHTSLLNLSCLSAHHGLFQDAIYYGEQALKVNKTLNANVRLIASQAQLGSHWIYGGHISEGRELLEAAESLSKELESSIELISLHMGLAALHRAEGNHKHELRSLLDADKIMASFIASESSDSSSTSSNVTDLEQKMDKLQVRPSSRRTTRQTTTATATATRRTRTATTSSRSAPKVTASSPEPPATESTTLSHLKSDIFRQQASCSRTLREFEKASALLDGARKFAVSRDSQISLHIGESEHFLADAIRHFASHAVYCVLPESTISLPSLQSPTKETASSSKTATTKRPRAPTRGARSRTQKATEDFSVMLSKASDCLNDVFSTATALGSTLDSHAASRLMSRISMLSHVTSHEAPALSLSPANVNEIGRIGAFAKEHVAISIDKQLADLSDPLLWPSSSKETFQLDDPCSNFTKEYVDILPASWNVLSLSLSADCSEFIVSRLHRDRSPFLLRLPLKRGNSEDEEEQFTFEDGREEMQELIKLANESAHAAKAQTDRQSKKDWWKNREALDARMENLLQNIENVWFGGFRGIFSPVPHDTAPLARFATSFHNILDKHLPSRQKGRRAEAPRLTLHPNVLELFIGIKDLGEQEDPEDTLMDLLYFVVDILQFQGERNAYDEIDFDMMVVETLDALRGYHEIVQDGHAHQAPNHTVLVLDKSLHLFPWESLPSLQGLPVCRVPSLECLRDRILRFRNEGATNLDQGLSIPRNNGYYVLNPTGDLQTTETTFEKDLSALDNWTGVVKRDPTEDEFKDGLESRSVFLYFGHGSGAQYIRGRTIKRLDRCAVTFLMGCSSGALTEAGEYEPYGTPMNYLQAGSPALVATLWDVTDKDIDRFAKSAFEEWGLIGGDANRGTGSRKTLDEAVSASRKACVLKYLNGAAPVIYGVPTVFLE